MKVPRKRQMPDRIQGAEGSNIIGPRLKQARRAHQPRWSGKQLCDVLHADYGLPMTVGTLSKIETGRRGVLDYELRAFTLALQVTSDWLLGISSGVASA
ncbi:helix-turn-helix transcriptional regulator [Deinococcus sp. YIM 134068]|uniref:helix-turn-helix domain-containing protein n=1 Tax=Deinococcus lichenicola TaxID=3118910 RepID=UPI002F9392D8